MSISEKHIKEYQALYKKEFGRDVSYNEADKQLSNLVNLLKIIYKPIKKKDFERFSRKEPEANQS